MADYIHSAREIIIYFPFPLEETDPTLPFKDIQLALVLCLTGFEKKCLLHKNDTQHKQRINLFFITFSISDILCGLTTIQKTFCSTILGDSFNFYICSVEQISFHLCLSLLQSILWLCRHAHNPRQLYLPCQATSCWRSRVSTTLYITFVYFITFLHPSYLMKIGICC